MIKHNGVPRPVKHICLFTAVLVIIIPNDRSSKMHFDQTSLLLKEGIIASASSILPTHILKLIFYL